jgi:hypothetical protein
MIGFWRAKVKARCNEGRSVRRFSSVWEKRATVIAAAQHRRERGAVCPPNVGKR